MMFFADRGAVPIGNWVVKFCFELMILVVYLARGTQGGRGDRVFMLAMAKPAMSVKLRWGFYVKECKKSIICERED